MRGLIERFRVYMVRVSPNALPTAGLFLGFMVSVLTGPTCMLHLER